MLPLPSAGRPDWVPMLPVNFPGSSASSVSRTLSESPAVVLRLRDAVPAPERSSSVRVTSMVSASLKAAGAVRDPADENQFMV